MEDDKYLGMIDEMRAEIENEKGKRLDELAFFKNQLVNFSTEEECNRYRKSLLILLYAHFEGYVKMALLVYLKFLNGLHLKMKVVKTELVASSIAKAFNDFRNSNRNPSRFDSGNTIDKSMNDLIKRKELLDAMAINLDSELKLDDELINTESNLWYIVLQKNLYRLGIPDDTFEKHKQGINAFVNRRNSIGHGNLVKGITEEEYNKYENIAYTIFTDINILIYSCASDKSYLRNINDDL